jgi:hypothetical protein
VIRMKTSMSFGISLLLAACLCGPASAQSADFKSGMTAYGAKNFKEAVRCFGKVVTAEPRNISAVYYLANSYYSLGQQTAALNYFRWLSENYPNTGEGRGAKSILARLGAQASARGESIAAEKAAAAFARAQSSPRASGELQVIVVGNLADHPPVQDKFLAKVKTCLGGIPPKVVAFLASQGCKVYVTPNMIDKEPELLNTRPRGYEDGRTYKNVPALFDGRDVVICNYTLGDDESWTPREDPSGSVRHEIGHAIDRYLGGVTRDDAFKLMYYKDCGKIEPEVKERLAYYVQKAQGGPSECFAECVATIFGGGDRGEQHYADIRAAFPTVIAYIQNLISQM